MISLVLVAQLTALPTAPREELAAEPPSTRSAPGASEWLTVEAWGELPHLWLQREGGSFGLYRAVDGALVDVSAEVGWDGERSFVVARWGDPEGDGWLDVLAVGNEGGVSWWSNVRGTLTEVPLDPLPGGPGRFSDARWLDVDGDGRDEMWLFGESPRLLRVDDGGGVELVPLVTRAVTLPGRSTRASATTEVFELPGTPTASAVGSTGKSGMSSSTVPRAGKKDRSPDPGRRGSATGGVTRPSPSSGLDADLAPPPVPYCADTLMDEATGACLSASTIPTLGSLYPLSVDLSVDASGRVGMGTSTPSEARLHILEDPVTGDALHAETSVGGAAAITAISTNDSDGFGIKAESNAPVGRAVRGVNEATTGNALGLEGVSRSSVGRAVYGIATSTSGTPVGVRGDVVAESGTGVIGRAGASADLTLANGAGVFGVSDGAARAGVVGKAEGTLGLGLFGIYGPPGGDPPFFSPASGVTGSTSEPGASGVVGFSQGATGTGVAGHAIHASGTTTGVYGSTVSLDGIGVVGQVGTGTAPSWSSGAGVLGMSSETFTAGVGGVSTTDEGGMGVLGVHRVPGDPAPTFLVAAGVSGASTSGTGVSGKGFTGVRGQGDTQTGYGVLGLGSVGVRGSGDVIGVLAEGDVGIDVEGDSTGIVATGHIGIEVAGSNTGLDASGDVYGVRGLSDWAGASGGIPSEPTALAGLYGWTQAGGSGVLGIQSGTDGVAGVWGNGSAVGVLATSSLLGSWAQATSPDQQAIGLLAEVDSSDQTSAAIQAIAGGQSRGVFVDSNQGVGVRVNTGAGTGIIVSSDSDAVIANASTFGGSGVIGTTRNAIGGLAGVRGNSLAFGSFGVYSSGDFVATGSKSFAQPHPTDASREIHFACLEGNESGTYFRGSGRIEGGRATIEVPEDFRLVTEAEGITVHVTPLGPAGLWVESKNLDGIVVRGRADIAFDYVVNGVRRGYGDFETLRANTSFRPQERGVAYGAQYPEELRTILVQNGTLNPDFTPNEATARRLGWKLRQPEHPDGERPSVPDAAAAALASGRVLESRARKNMKAEARRPARASERWRPPIARDPVEYVPDDRPRRAGTSSSSVTVPAKRVRTKRVEPAPQPDRH